MLHLQLAGSRFADIGCNQVGLSQNRFVITAMTEADYFNVYDLRRRTFSRDPRIPAISTDSLICNRSALVVIQPQEKRVCVRVLTEFFLGQLPDCACPHQRSASNQ
jgi:hypothetical protein